MKTSAVAGAFDADGLTFDLRGRSVRGGTVTLAAQVVRTGLQIGSTVVLARLLTPADFGLVAMVAVFTGVIGLLRDMGLSTATVQRNHITQDQVSALFWINVGASIALTLIAAAAAPALANFYHEPRLTAVMLATAPTFLLGGLAGQHLALIRREMRYGALAAIDVVSLVSGILAAVAIVLLGGGYWGLVAMPVVTAFVAMWMAWALSPWRPGSPGRAAGLGSMVRFGGNLTVFNFTNYFGRNADNALIGWWWGAAPLGLYSRAYSLLMLPLNQVNAPLAGVVVGTLSRLQDDPPRFRHYYCRVVNLISYATLPMLAVLAALSREIIVIALGEQWTAAAAVFSVLAIAAIGQPLLWTAAWVHISLGRAHRLRNWGLVTDPLFVVSFLAGLPWGPIGVAACYAVSANVVVIPGLMYAAHQSPFTTRDVAAAIWRPCVLAMMAFGGALIGRHAGFASGGDWSVLASGAVGALVAMAVASLLTPGARSEIASLVALLRPSMAMPVVEAAR